MGKRVMAPTQGSFNPSRLRCDDSLPLTPRIQNVLKVFSKQMLQRQYLAKSPLNSPIWCIFLAGDDHDGRFADSFTVKTHDEFERQNSDEGEMVEKLYGRSVQELISPLKKRLAEASEKQREKKQMQRHSQKKDAASRSGKEPLRESQANEIRIEVIPAQDEDDNCDPSLSGEDSTNVAPRIGSEDTSTDGTVDAWFSAKIDATGLMDVPKARKKRGEKSPSKSPRPKKKTPAKKAQLKESSDAEEMIRESFLRGTLTREPSLPSACVLDFFASAEANRS